jgi:hypothetical protein
VKQWHGATRSQAMTHVSVTEAADGKTVESLQPVTAAEYRGSE